MIGVKDVENKLILITPSLDPPEKECPGKNASPHVKDVENKLSEISSNKDPVMRKSDSNKNIAGFRYVMVISK